MGDNLYHEIAERVEAAIDNGLPSKAKGHLAVEDVNAIAHDAVERVREAGFDFVNRDALANYLLTHTGGDETQDWQAGHNYAMREAARLIRTSTDRLGAL